MSNDPTRAPSGPVGLMAHVDHAIAARAHAAPVVSLLRPIGSLDDQIAFQAEVRERIARALKPGVDFAVVPGTKRRLVRDEWGEVVKGPDRKPLYETLRSLMQPGAQKIAGWYGLRPNYIIVEREVDHFAKVEWWKTQKGYDGNDDTHSSGVSVGLYRYVVEAQLIEMATGMVRGSHVAVASSLEGKYVERPRESENTIAHMAGKRGVVAAVRFTFGLSDEFTQEIEDDDDVVTRAEADKRAKDERFRDAPKPLASRAEALAVLVPGEKKRDNPFGGDPLAAVPPDYLQKTLLPWLTRLVQEQANAGGDDAVDPKTRHVLIACNMVLQPEPPTPTEAPPT